MAISLMVWRGLDTLFQAESLPFRPLLVGSGAILFYVSDAALTWDRFIRPLPLRQVIVMGTYFTAQYCFALSVAWPPTD
jgi:alkenylglycerophosphocholine/alkenylglycerophosphoethanolamine hydrolase